MNFAWSVEEIFSAADAAVISDGVFQFGRAEAVGGDARLIACFLREGSVVIAGATGRTEYQRLFINYLWVRDDHRGTGLGREALRLIELEATQRGATDAWIETLNDGNADLYRSLGYQPLAVLPNAVGPFTRHILLKRLAHVSTP